MQKLIIVIIVLCSIINAQEFNYSKMSNTEKIMMYNSMKKSPVAAGFLEIIPTAGYAYSGKWERGVMIKLGIPIGIGIVAVPIALSLEGPQCDGPSYCTSEDIIFSWLSISLGAYFYSFYDVLNQTSKYNKRLHRRIFGKKKPKMKASLYPIHDGAGLTLIYSFY